MDTFRKTVISLGLTSVATLSLASCGSGDDDGNTVAQGSAISEERCQKNKDAGKITYLSGYQFQASASILDYVAAEKLGYFDALCLDVQLNPGTGDVAQNTKLLASGQTSVAAISQQDVIQARANGIDITGVSSYSDAGLDVLMTNEDITELSQLNGKIVGHKGNMPASIRGMMVENGVDWDSIRLVQQGYDPTVLPRRQQGLEALTAFASNEPNLLKEQGETVTVWQPADYGIPSSLGAMAVNPDFAEAHPEAVADLIRASLKAFDYCSQDDHVSECVGYAADLSGAVYDKDHNSTIWKTEVQIVKDHPFDGMPVGSIDTSNIDATVDLLHEYDIVGDKVTKGTAQEWFDGSYVSSIYDNGSLIWPAP